MFCVRDRWLRFPFRALARLVPRLAPRFFRTLGFSAAGLLWLLLPASVLAGEVTLVWDATENSGLAGYKLYYGEAKGSYDGVLDVGPETTYTFTDLEEGRTYYFALAAYDIHGEESDLSPDVVHHGPLGDSPGEPEEATLRDWEEIDQAASAREPFPAAAGESHADDLDIDPAREQDLTNNRDPHRSTALLDLEVIPQAELSIVSVDSETLVGDGAAESAIDGRVETFWHTETGAKASLPPHELVVALGEEYVVTGFRYLPRQDGKKYGMVARYSFYVSEDGEDWGEAITSGTFSSGMAEQQVTFPEKAGRFVRFVAQSEVNGKPWTSMAELNVLGVR